MIKKLRHKSLGELWFRGRHVIKKKWERWTYTPDLAEHLTANIPEPVSREAFFQHPARQKFFFHSQREQCKNIYLQAFPEELERGIQRAEQFYQLQFDMLGARFSYKDRIDWHVNPVTQKNYSKQFYQDITIFTDDGQSDIKHVWEINRHQYFIELSKAYFLTGNEKYARRTIELFDDWVSENPYKIGVNWTSALEAAVRVYSWIWSLFFLADAPQLSRKVLHRFLKQIYLHGQFIQDNLSYYFSPYNHLIGELSALNFIAQVFPELPQSQRWERFAWKALVKEMPRQFKPDGIIVEQATFYHHFTLGFYLMPAVLKQYHGYALPKTISQYLRNAFEFNMMMTRPDGTFPSVGDIDNARSIYFREPEQWDFRNVLAIGAGLFQRGDWKWVAGRSWEEILWFFGADGWQKYKKLQAYKPQQTRQVFHYSGYGIARSGWENQDHFCWMDFGEIADGVYPDDTFSAAHGHADVLHFEITANGKNFLVDSGFHNYRGNFEWHRHFRLTRAHNTIEIDGQSQALHGPRMMLWAKVPQTRLLHWVHDDQVFYLCATHNGFRHLSGNPRHVRNFFFIFNTFWVIWDELLGEAVHRVASYLHFNAGTEVIINEPIIQSQLEGEQLLILSHGALQEIILQKGGKQPQEGWISPLYRHPQPAPQVTFSGKVAFPQHHCWVMVPTSPGTTFNDTGRSFQVSSQGKKIAITFEPQPHLPVKNFFFFAQLENSRGVYGIAFGKNEHRYSIIKCKQEKQQWVIKEEESFEAETS